MTPLARAAGREVTTLDGLPDADAGRRRSPPPAPSQCGFCTPGIVMRVAALAPAARQAPAAVHQALAAHLCRCTGWQPIVEAVRPSVPGRDVPSTDAMPGARRASIEGRTAAARRRRGGDGGGFADDIAPADALVADPRRRRGVARRRDADRGPRRRRARAGSAHDRRRRRGRSPSPTASGCARCRRRGSSRPTSNPTPRGARPVASRRRRSPTVARSAARSPARWPPSPAAWPTSTAVPCGSCTPARTSCARGPKRPPIGAGIRADGTGRRPRRAHAGHRRRDRHRRPGPHGRGGRRRRPADVEPPSVPPAGPRRRSCWPRSATAPTPSRRRQARRRRRRSTTPACTSPLRCGDAARRGRAAQLLHRRRPHGPRVGAQRGARRRRRRDAARPDDPLVRDPAGPGRPADHRRHRARATGRR